MRAPSSSGGSYVKDFFGTSQIDQDIVPSQNMVEYINYIMDQIETGVDSKFMSDKSEILLSLGMDQTFQSWELGDCQALTSNTFYSHNLAVASIWTYFFTQANDANQVVCEYVTLNVRLNLLDDIVILHHQKKKRFGGKTSWDEQVRIPATITAQTVVNAFATLLIPLIQGNIAMPSNVIPQLKETAMAEAGANDYDEENSQKVIDQMRQTVIDPQTGKGYVPDESLLALLVPKWVRSSGEVLTSSVRNDVAKDEWEFV